MSSNSAQNKKLSREEKREEKRKKKAAKGPGVFASFKQGYQLSRDAYPNTPWLLALIVLATIAVFLLLGLLLHNWLTFLILGLVAAMIFATIFIGRRTRKASYAQIEGQPGAAGAALSQLGRGWIVEQQPVAVNPRSQDLVFRALGRPGVVLVAEGPSQRVNSLVAQERKKLHRVVPNVAIHVVKAGNGEDQVALQNIAKEIRKFPKTLTTEQVHVINNRLASLNRGMPVPKGIDPMRARPDRRGLRGR